MSVFVKGWIAIGLVLLAGYTAYTLVRITGESRARPVAVNAATPEEQSPSLPLDLESFTMTGQDGREFRFDQLRGKVWIASLFFSSCPHECKSLNESIAALHRDPEFEDVQFVSISVDPAIDDPLTLHEYAKLFDADPKQWSFLTGNLHDVGRFGREINLPAGYKTHTRRLVLFDREGKLRGYFLYNNSGDIARLKAMLGEVLKESAGKQDQKSTQSRALRSQKTTEVQTASGSPL
ncbi:MAG: SCO family protein [Pirellulales bacterium]|nr:SCO family protein [Pirellulales bacterium]HJN65768.1 SCO family protein [Pirellulales bacterium]